MSRATMCKKSLLQFLMLIAIGGLLIFLMVEMLFNSHPRTSPAVQDTSRTPHASALPPMPPSGYRLIVRATAIS